ncbi:dihydroneopterin triphosphate diphosphatase [Thiorhodococcus minor]|uniref:Dihydroneopterin triphosphate diphosphatase n=1 Tax=Thiorhodococcus minor TaxID=57489 RepID=A0A6M0JVR9_9GAMM|nr:dihydroneopterin triphosphate diphosphatase [Thiorhodococcus minor]
MSKTERKRPQSVLVVVCTRQGEFLLMERTRPEGFWQSVTGSLAPGETARLCAAREVLEETGLRPGGGLIDLRQSVLFPIIPAWRKRYAPNVCFNREYWFALILDSRRLIRLSRREHSEHRWLSAPEAMELTGSWTNRDAIQRVASLLDPVGACGTAGQGARTIRRTTRVIDPRFRRAISKK